MNNNPDPVLQFIQSTSSNATQKNWVSAMEFPLCPTKVAAKSLEYYWILLEYGEVFSKSHQSQSIVVATKISPDGDLLSVVSRTISINVMPWMATEIRIVGDQYEHTLVGSFFSLERASQAAGRIANDVSSI